MNSHFAWDPRGCVFDWLLVVGCYAFANYSIHRRGDNEINWQPTVS